MWIWLDKTGRVKQYLMHGPAPVAGDTDFQIFAYFDGLDTSFYDYASIKFRRPDINGSTFEFQMSKVTMPYVYSSSDGSMSKFNENNSPYTGFLFDFSDFTSEQEETCYLDTPGLWKASIALQGQGRVKVSGMITFNVGDSAFVTDESTTPTIEEIIDNLIRVTKPLSKNSTRYLKVADDFVLEAENGELDGSIFTIGSVVFDKATNKIYKILGIVVNPVDNIKVYASYEEVPLGSGTGNANIYYDDTLPENTSKLKQGDLWFDE